MGSLIFTGGPHETSPLLDIVDDFPQANRRSSRRWSYYERRKCRPCFHFQTRHDQELEDEFYHEKEAEQKIGEETSDDHLIECPRCYDSFANKKLVEEHLKKEHAPKSKLPDRQKVIDQPLVERQCNLCGDILYSKSGLWRHKQLKHKEETVIHFEKNCVCVFC